uniref:SUMF1/EgtB/PvdO family nonheme iron enzyme n=1 Tax=Ningiella ruwaisensis TaxID=2364274 RepID=UPI00144509D9|nr:SUMF1/EgtB/PvdO family nonheme iron enzyme [Ningiella ruwaisensis]
MSIKRKDYQDLQHLKVSDDCEVLKAQHILSGQWHVLKKAKTEAGRVKLHREVLALRQIKDSGIALEPLDAVNDEHGTSLIIYPFVELTLRQFIQDGSKNTAFEAQSILRLCLDLVQQVIKLHALGWRHGDLHPGNIVIVEQKPRLIDFANSWKEDDKQLGPKPINYGARPYAAPEKHSQIVGSETAEEQAEVYNLSAIIAAVLGRFTYVRERQDLIRHLDQSPVAILPDLLKLLHKGLSVDAKSRFSNPADLYEALYEALNEALGSFIDTQVEPSIEPKLKNSKRGQFLAALDSLYELPLDKKNASFSAGFDELETQALNLNFTLRESEQVAQLKNALEKHILQHGKVEDKAAKKYARQFLGEISDEQKALILNNLLETLPEIEAASTNKSPGKTLLSIMILGAICLTYLASVYLLGQSHFITKTQNDVSNTAVKQDISASRAPAPSPSHFSVLPETGELPQKSEALIRFMISAPPSQYTPAHNKSARHSDIEISFMRIAYEQALPQDKNGKELGASNASSSAKYFYVMTEEVSQALWQSCVDAGACANRRLVSTSAERQNLQLAMHPVVNVSWYDISNGFLPWINKILQNQLNERFSSASSSASSFARAQLALPTMQEWLRFAYDPIIANNQGKQRLKIAPSTHCADCQGASGYTSDSEEELTTLPINSLKANSLGLYHVHGNVQEWLQDCWQDVKLQLERCDQAPAVGGHWMQNKQAIEQQPYQRLLKSARSISTGFRLVIRDGNE